MIFYIYISVDKYVTMSDHFHLLITILNEQINGQSGIPVPTKDNFKIDNKNSGIVKRAVTFKRFCNKEYGENIRQKRYYDHIVRNQTDYNETWEYIDNNPHK